MSSNLYNNIVSEKTRCMQIQELMSQKKFTMYRLSKNSVPFTTVNDICNGRARRGSIL